MKIYDMLAQVRDGRALLGWSRDRLASRADISVKALKKIETQRSVRGPGDLEAVCEALEEAGIQFIAENDGSPGVRLRKEGGT